MAQMMIAHIDKKRKALGLDKGKERILMDMWQPGKSSKLLNSPIMHPLRGLSGLHSLPGEETRAPARVSSIEKPFNLRAMR
jgi:hypothetical protein